MDAAHQIRQRFIRIILRALLTVLLVTMLAVVVTIAVVLSTSSNNYPFNEIPVVTKAESYYLGKGGWDGVEIVFENDSLAPSISLLDDSQLILIDHGNTDGPNVGLVYQSTARSIMIDLKAHDKLVGFLVIDRSVAISPDGGIVRVLVAVILLFGFLTLIATMLIGLLSGRVITPLADVIAASSEVAAGKLNTRVIVRGPQDLQIMSDSFNHMAASLERNEQMRRNLFTDIAHELRTPISAIRGRLEGMLDGVYPADEKHISLALQSSYLLGRLVDDLRLLTLAESGNLTFDTKEISLSSIIRRIVELFGAEASEKSIILSQQIPSEDIRILADPIRIEQVIGNLISNALRYIPMGSEICVSAKKDNTWVTLSIQDNGPGIAEEDLPLIFDRFWRKDKSRSRNYGGSGLGLTIAKQLIESQGGTISAKNNPEGGLLINIYLPSI